MQSQSNHTYSHSDIFDPSQHPQPKVLFSPPKYIQGPDVIHSLGKYLKLCERNPTAVAVIISSGGVNRYKHILKQAIADYTSTFHVFSGECSYSEADRLVTMVPVSVDVLVGIGGGKLLDCGKLVAHKIGVPFVSIPSIASNDCPCSALSIMYTDEHTYAGGLAYPFSPCMVVVDTAIICQAPVRYLVSGMGDAMATYYEARTCYSSNRLSMLGAKPTLAAMSLARLCADILYDHGVEALQACTEHRSTQAFESVVEACTLLSGVGFESGGLSAAHGVAQALTVLPEVEKKFMHGEMVAVGLLTMLALQKDVSELLRVMGFCKHVGLPYSYSMIGVDLSDERSVNVVTAAALDQWFTHNEATDVTHEVLYQSMHDVDRAATNH